MKALAMYLTLVTSKALTPGVSAETPTQASTKLDQGEGTRTQSELY